MVRALVIVMLCCAGAWGDVVWTSGERLEGDVKVKGGAVEVGGKQVGWDEVYSISREAKETISGPHVLRLRNGERWVGEFLRYGVKKVRFASPIFGEREIDVALVEGVDFVGKAEAGEAAATLYRTVGEPLPGTLLWVNSQQLAIESPLGAVTLQREGAIRYNFPAGKSIGGGGDVVTLIDGTVLKGKSAPAEGRVTLTHALLGELSVPVAAVRNVARDGNVAWLNDAEVLAGEAATFKTGAGTLRMFVRPVEGARSDVTVKVTSGGKTVAEKVVSKEEVLSVEVSGDATVEAVLGEQKLFPAGVVVTEAHVVPKR